MQASEPSVPSTQADVVLTTFNARYIHSSLGLRYLYANMAQLQSRTHINEMTLALPVEESVERLLAMEPRIIGFGVYIWNVEKTLEAVRLLKAVAPEVTVVVGGPEVSFDVHDQALCLASDYVITGQADQSFADLCLSVLSGDAPSNKVVSSLPLDLTSLASPYPFYTEADLRHRLVYVEASRGCPFKCEFCLSSLDKTATPFPLHTFLSDMQSLLERGAKHFKFVDRTFNLKVDTCINILDFFLQYLPGGARYRNVQGQELFLHFELIPDRLPERLQHKLLEFPDGVLQFEIGIQSFNPEVQQLINRRQDMNKTLANIRWLREHTNAHIHADLIFGLPGESLESFANGFNQLVALQPQEIQLGILKLLRGTPIARHTKAFGMVYQDGPPYRILKNDLLDFPTVQRISRFARYWDLVANSGRFVNSMPLLLGDSPFERFLALSDWLFAKTGQTHKIALPRLFRLIADASTQIFLGNDSTDQEMLRFLAALQTDFNTTGFSGELHKSARTTQVRATSNSPDSSHRDTKLEEQNKVQKSCKSNSPDSLQESVNVKSAASKRTVQKPSTTKSTTKLRQHRHLAGS